MGSVTLLYYFEVLVLIDLFTAHSVESYVKYTVSLLPEFLICLSKIRRGAGKLLPLLKTKYQLCVRVSASRSKEPPTIKKEKSLVFLSAAYRFLKT
jgi:hypothetical protein